MTEAVLTAPGMNLLVKKLESLYQTSSLACSRLDPFFQKSVDGEPTFIRGVATIALAASMNIDGLFQSHAEKFVVLVFEALNLSGENVNRWSSHTFWWFS